MLSNSADSDSILPFLRWREEKSTEQNHMAEAVGLASAATAHGPARRALAGFLQPSLALGNTGEQELVESRWLQLNWVRRLCTVCGKSYRKNSPKSNKTS